MKKKLNGLLGLLLVMALSLGLLSGCGGKKETLTGAYDNYEYEISLEFSEDGSVVISTYVDTLDGTYELEEGEVTVSADGESLVLTVDEEGDLVSSDYGYFIQTDSPSYVPGAGSDPGDMSDTEDEEVDTSFISSIDIVGSSFELEGNYWNFYEGRTLSVNDEVWGEYVWEGESGQISIDGDTTTIMQDSGDLYMQGEDGEFYLMTYAGPVDSSYVGNSEDQEPETYEEGVGDGYVIEGAYDNDEVGISAEFDPADGSFVISDGTDLDTGLYTVDADGYLYMSGDMYDYSGYYDASDDTFYLDGYDGYFYWVSETGYY